MRIHLFDRQKDLKLNKSSVRALVKQTLQCMDVETDEVSIYFVSDKKMRELHTEFFDDPSPTDCISFPIDKVFLGEVFVCPKTAIEYASKHSLDAHQECALYVIHGLLHLLGYDDLSPKEKRVMRKKEKLCIQYVHEAIPSFSLRLAPSQ